jgi:hypothetical protein
MTQPGRKLSGVISSLMILLTVTAVFSQDEKGAADKRSKPDLSGTWVLDKTRSAKVDYDLILEIVHREPEITITRTFVERASERKEESVYYTDGRAEAVKEKLQHIYKPVTKWRGTTLVRESVHVTRGTKFEVVTTEQWSLSKDGQTLTRTVTNRQQTSINETILPRFESKYTFTRRA